MREQAQYSGRMQTLGNLWQRSVGAVGSCAVCGRWPAAAICNDCMLTFGATVPRCPKCALALAPGLVFCSDCAGSAPPDRPPWLLNECVARVDYVYPWSDLIVQFKFQQKPAVARHLAEMLANDETVVRLLDACELCTPIPLTPSGLVTRGYNQSWELLKALTNASRADWTPCHNLLVRADMTTKQHRLSRSERLANQQLRFAVPIQHKKRILNRHVLLIDDVMTTGATLNAAASALLGAGAYRVSGLVFARTSRSPRNL